MFVCSIWKKRKPLKKCTIIDRVKPIRLAIVDKMRKVNHDSSLEFYWTLIPALILFFLALPSVYFLYLFDTYLIEETPMLVIKVIGNQWYWTYEHCIYHADSFFTYTFDSYMVHTSDFDSAELRLLTTDNPLILPINVPIKFIVTASDVLHSWAIPSLGIKMDACPGRLNQFFGMVERVGEFYGQCSEICGVNHGFMPIEIIALK